MSRTYHHGKAWEHHVRARRNGGATVSLNGLINADHAKLNAMSDFDALEPGEEHYTEQAMGFMRANTVSTSSNG